MESTNEKNIISEDLSGQSPYYNPFNGISWTVAGHRFHIACARGFNARGLIGTERNGIFILSKTDKRIVLGEHMPQASCWSEDPLWNLKVIAEIDRIVAMGVTELMEFIGESPKMCYNPLEDHATTTIIEVCDRKLRDKWPPKKFTDAKYMTALQKANLVADTERFVHARIFGGVQYARSWFTAALYDELHLHFGHIAHYDRGGFYEVQMESAFKFESNLKLIAAGKSLYGYPAGGDGLEDLHKAMAAVTKPYLKDARTHC